MNEKVICTKTYTYSDSQVEVTFNKGELYELDPGEDFSRNGDSVYIRCNFKYVGKYKQHYEGIRFYHRNEPKYNLRFSDFFKKYDLKEERKIKLKKILK